MSKIRKFFSKKKEEAAFKFKLGVLGEGHTLNAVNTEASTSCSRTLFDEDIPPNRKELSNEVKTAAAAALARVEKKDAKNFNTSLAAVKAQAKKELDAYKEPLSEHINVNTSSLNFACKGVFFRCPFISDEVLSKNEWKIKIKEFLYQQLEVEKGLTSCLIIYNCNVKEKAEDCIGTLSKYLENIINYPNDEKYHKIRMLNRIFCEKVRYVEGALDFLYAAGFRELNLDNELYLMWTKEHMENELEDLLEALQNAEKIQLVLDRNIKVLLPSQAKRITLPDDFYRISPGEIKREQKLRADAVESAQILKTKAMREREEQRSVRMYKYTLVRVKFPNGIFIQGTFNVFEKLSNIFEFVQSCLQDEVMEFNLIVPSEEKFREEDMNKTLFDLRLVPNIVLFFNACDAASSRHDANFLKEELLLLIQPN